MKEINFCPYMISLTQGNYCIMYAKLCEFDCKCKRKSEVE